MNKRGLPRYQASALLVAAEAQFADCPFDVGEHGPMPTTGTGTPLSIAGGSSTFGPPLATDRRDGNVDLLLHGSSCRATFSLFNNDIAAARPALSAFSAHSAFGFCANAKADTADHHTYTGRWTFFNNPASLGSRFLNNVVVRQ
jgi:hypothetical protein